MNRAEYKQLLKDIKDALLTKRDNATRLWNQRIQDLENQKLDKRVKELETQLNQFGEAWGDLLTRLNVMEERIETLEDDVYPIPDIDPIKYRLSQLERKLKKSEKKVVKQNKKQSKLERVLKFLKRRK